ncbi:MAG TPA: glycosyltransferase [Gammaproteobacteria bacterium]|nr:glycosyltransferase [Gammaproteobacteria bacterium]
MSKQILNLIEPTLFDQTGHGYSYVHSLLTANQTFPFAAHVWLDKRGAGLLSDSLCTTHAYFWRPLRQVQKVFLYVKLLMQANIIFVCTSDLWDLKLLAFYAQLFKSKSKIFLHFHQFKQTNKKLAALRKLAGNEYVTILAPTEKLLNVFRGAGFVNCHVVPCPTFAPPQGSAPRSHTLGVLGGDDKIKVLYAGAARSDKGFPLVVQLLQDLRRRNIDVPFEVQISTPNSQRYDHATESALQTLRAIPTHNLTLHEHTLDQSQYLNLFNNAICLLLYDQSGYNDKFSGVTLDAFYAGCPIITIQDTWMGDTAVKYDAGIALANYELATIEAAINKILNNYAHYHANAKAAAQQLRDLHDPKNTLQNIYDSI